MFLKIYDLFEKFLTNYQMVYLEQKCTRLLYLVDNHYWQYYNELILLLQSQDAVHFHCFLSFVILFSVLSSNIIVSGVKSSRLYPSSILNVILFSILFTYICSDGLSMFSAWFFFKCIQNNLEYLIQNMIHLLIKINLPCLGWYFKFIVIVWAFYVFTRLVNTKIW